MKKVYSGRSQRVFVGMSGGVDSSVSAGLLKRAGFDVVGVFIKIEIDGNCGWRDERREARRASAHLDIPLLTLDLSKEYRKKVVDYLVAEYKAGRTPNPDVMCNQTIKFGAFYDWAMAHGADFVATGHYAQIARPETNLSSHGQNGEFETKFVSDLASAIKTNSRLAETLEAKKDGEAVQRFCLQVSADSEKDQTYFLWNLTQEQLSRILFPIGGYTKPQVRALAKKFGLPNADKKDSQGLCFIGKIDFKDFLKRKLPEKIGEVIDEEGKIIGRHFGAMLFTIGERHGFAIFQKTPDGRPYYIVAKNVKKNTLTVSQNNQGRALITEVKIAKANWISEVARQVGLEAKPRVPSEALAKDGEATQRFRLQGNFLARVRYRQPLQSCQIKEINSHSAVIVFNQPQLAVSGQSLVLYAGDICLGGGVIV